MITYLKLKKHGTGFDAAETVVDMNIYWVGTVSRLMLTGRTLKFNLRETR